MADPRRPSPADRAAFIDQHYLRGDATGLIATAITDRIGRPAAEVNA
jgi:hypothetical protein